MSLAPSMATIYADPIAADKAAENWDSVAESGEPKTPKDGNAAEEKIIPTELIQVGDIVILRPGYWDVAAGGMVAAGETYEQSAARELEEELGVSGVELTAHERFYFEAPQNHLWCGVFSGV